MNKKVNNLATLVMMLASVAMVVFIYHLVSAGDPDSLQVSAGVPSQTDVRQTMSSVGVLPFTSLADIAGTKTTSAPMSVHSIETEASQTTTTTTQSDMRMIVITGEAANIRAKASVDSMVIGVVYHGDSLRVIGEEKDAASVLWYKVELGNVIGYVCSTATIPNEEYYVKKAYLTFDDGPSKNTLAILDILDSYGVKGTFFVIHHTGVDELYREIVRRGHAIALHSYTHDYSNIYSSTDAYFADLSLIEQQVSSLTGVSPRIIRFPGGSSNSISSKYRNGIMTELASMVEQRGYVYHDWNVESGDADATTVPKDVIVENVKKNLGTRSSAVILMHDAPTKTTTVEALPEIIEYLQSQDYAIIPISASTPPVHHRITN